MAKYYGEIGFAENKENPEGSGIIKETLSKRMYRGDVIRYARKLVPGDSINDSVTVDNVITIVADPYALNHFFAIRYAAWQGTRWKVSNVEVRYPRLQLTLGGVYNGPEN